MSSFVNGTVTDGYVSDIDFLHDPEIYNKLFDRYHESTFMDFFEQTARQKACYQTEFHHFEKDYIYSTVTVDSVGGGASAGADATITIAAADHQESGKRSPFVKGAVLMIGNQYKVWVKAKDTTTDNAHVLTVTPVNSAIQLDAVVSAGDVIVNISNAHSEGSGQPESESSLPLRFSGQVQIFKNQFDVTGSEAGNKTEVNTSDGRSFWMYEGISDLRTKHKLDIEYGFLLGERGTDSVTDPTNSDEAVRFTDGMDSQITTYGNIQNYSVSFDQMSYFDDIIKTMALQRCPTENLLMAGIELDLDIDNLLTDVTKMGGIRYDQFGKGNGKNKAIELGFDSFIKGNYTFHKKRFDALNHEKITASTADSPWPGVGYIIPLEQTKDARSGKSLETIMCRYKTEGGQGPDRKYKHWKRDYQTTNIDKIEFNYQTEAGVEFALLNKFFKIQSV